VKLCIGDLRFGEMEFGEMKRNTSNWSNFWILLRRAGLSASSGLSCTLHYIILHYITLHYTTLHYNNSAADITALHCESKKLGHFLRPITLEILNRSSGVDFFLRVADE